MSTSDSWHVDPVVLSHYARGSLGGSTAASVETHLLACPQCRTGLATAVDPARLTTLWDGVVDRLDAPRRTPVERLMVRLGVAEHTARLVAAAPSLTVSWLSGVATALFFAVLAADAGPRGLLFFLSLAPVLPVAGVAVAYGRDVDPTHDVGTAAPYSTLRLLLLRASAVLVSTLFLVGIGAVVLPLDGWLTAAWLLPSLALSTATLALSTRVDPVWAGGLTVTAWLLAVLTTVRSTGSAHAAFGAGGQLISVLLLALSVAVLVHRRHSAADLRGNP